MLQMVRTLAQFTIALEDMREIGDGADTAAGAPSGMGGAAEETPEKGIGSRSNPNSGTAEVTRTGADGRGASRSMEAARWGKVTGRGIRWFLFLRLSGCRRVGLLWYAHTCHVRVRGSASRSGAAQHIVLDIHAAAQVSASLAEVSSPEVPKGRLQSSCNVGGSQWPCFGWGPCGAHRWDSGLCRSLLPLLQPAEVEQLLCRRLVLPRLTGRKGVMEMMACGPQPVRGKPGTSELGC